MEIVWAGIGFLVGMSLWMPFIIDVRVDTKLIRLESRITAQIAQASRQLRRT